MASQKSRSSSTSRALVDSPRREDSTDSPARSCLVKINPRRPRAAWLWSICSARLDLPQSMVPEKKTSSATSRNPMRCRAPEPAGGAPTPPRASAPRAARARPGAVAAPRQPLLGDRAEPPLGDRLLPLEHPRPLGETPTPGLHHVRGRTGLAVQLQRAGL